MSKPITGKNLPPLFGSKSVKTAIFTSGKEKSVYIPETRKTKELSRKLLGKIPAGSTDGEIVPTRPKRKKTEDAVPQSSIRSKNLDQLRFCVGSASKAVLQKICSLAWMRARLKR